MPPTTLAGRACFALSIVAFSAGCTINSRGAAEPMVRARAADDLDCPQKDIRLEQIELGNRYKAKGCGQIKIYRTACQGLQCTVAGDGEPAIPWRDRPAPDEPHR
jgi:hypothetical protein